MNTNKNQAACRFSAGANSEPQLSSATVGGKTVCGRRARYAVDGLLTAVPCRVPARRAPTRQGILLLVVLSMLTLFLLIGTAFIVSADHYRKSNKIQARLTETSNSSIDQGNLLDEVIGQIIRDTNNQNSTLRFHSLLRDMYGHDGFFGEIRPDSTTWAGGLSNPTGGQMLQFSLDTVEDQFGNPVPPNSLSLFRDAYNGQVLTFLDGPARGQSVRITSYIPWTTVSPAIFRVMTPRLEDGSSITQAAGLATLNDSRVVVNGRPFNGTGAGYRRTAGKGDAALDFVETVPLAQDGPYDAQIALTPNSAFTNVDQIFDAYFLTQAQENDLAGGTLTAEDRARIANSIGLGGLGGSDESYDAVDYQNMLLALMQPNAVETVLPDLTSVDPVGLGNTVIPSNHRPAMLNWWREQIRTTSQPLDSEPNLLRKVLLRPNWLDHPNFTGSNPDFANADSNSDRLRRMIYGPWDVDNDNDGVRDSVWVDFGAPVIENSDGKLVKPLAAILVLDLDGRLNLNAHGSEDTANPVDFFSLSGAGSRLGELLELAGYRDPANPNSVMNPLHNTDNVAQGQGYGPAEISLEPLMPGVDRASRWEWYQRLFTGTNVNERVVPDAVDVNAGLNPKQFRRRRIGKLGGRLDPTGAVDIWPGLRGFDRSAQLKMQGVPQWANGRVRNASNALVLGGYATPPDPRGRYALGLNDLGQPVHEAIIEINNDRARINSDSPYESDLSLGAARGESTASADAPYALSELERILRCYDADAGALPSRIWEMAGEFKDGSSDTTPNLDRLNTWRAAVTTDSYDLPVPSVVLPEWMRLGPDGEFGPAGAPAYNDDFEAVMGRPPVGLTFADLLEYQLRISPHLEDSSTAPWTGNLTQDQLREIAKLLPPDLADGLRLDINRPLGNGRDDNNNQVVDEPGEWNDLNNNGSFEAGEAEVFWVAENAGDLPTSFTNQATAQFRDERIMLEDRNNDRRSNATDLTLIGINGAVDTLEELVTVHNLRRQLLARDLYVMAMTLVDPPLPTATTRDKQARARRLAQWAINLVDFRDPDNCQTGFEYDTNPFDGWSPDGSLLTTRDVYGTDDKPGGLAGTGSEDQGGVVWGAEGAELVMTETMSWHDRRTTDESSPIESSNIQGEITQKAAFVTDPKDADFDYDQLYRPRGACFVELYCPLPANPAANADTHAIGDGLTDFDLDGRPDPIGQDMGIHLAAFDKTSGTSPVWRMAVYQRPETMQAIDCADWDPDSPIKERRPYDTSSLAEIDIDRTIYFAPFDKSDVAQLKGLKDMDVSDGVEFFTTLNMSTVRPGRFMVIGSGEEQDGNGRKQRGSGIYGANIGDKDATSRQQRRIELDPTNLRHPIRFFEPSNAADRQGDELAFVDPDANNRAVCDVGVITNALSSTGPTALPRRFTITEPARGYPGDDPTLPSQGPSFYDGDATKEGRYGNIAQAAAYDTPHDDNRLDGERRLRLIGNFQPNEPLVVECFSMIYLQRLANPLLPFHKDTNPYRTVDSMSANTSVFNGRVGNPTNPGGEVFQPDPNGGEATQIEYSSEYAVAHFASLQRGFAVNQISQSNNVPYLSNVLSYEPPNEKAGPLVAGGIDGENTQLARFGIQTVRKNQFAGGFASDLSNRHAINVIPDMTLGRLNGAFLPVSTQVAMKARNAGGVMTDGLTPEEPFPWLTWNNRPFSGSNELLLVPRSSSSQLLREFSGQVNGTNAFSNSDVPKEKNVKNTFDKRPAYATQEEVGLFGHLPNMFLSEMPAADRLPDVPAGLFRVLDYLHVPNPFVGTETWLNPASFGSTPVTDIDDPRYARQPPLNRIAEYRDPGRLNLNTVVSGDVWDGGVLHRTRFDSTVRWDPLTNNYRVPDLTRRHPGHAGPLFVHVPITAGQNVDGLVESRRGYPGAKTSTPPGSLAPDDMMLLLDNRVPTFFANPFRASDAGNLVPLRNLARPGSECSLLRRRTMNPGADGQWGMAGSDDDGQNGVDDVGEFDPNSDSEDERPLFGGTSTEPYNDSTRNAYFGMRPMTRLSSMTTNRSNVYAVWVTVGFFEVEEAPTKQVFLQTNDPNGNLSPDQQNALYAKVYPGGYQLGPEAGSETGDLRRVREFAILDRTVPVAFEPGQNHNVDKVVRLRRRIE